MNELATKAGNSIKELSKVFAAYPAPDKWTGEMKTQAVQFAALLDTAQKIISTASLAGVDWKKERDTFLTDTRSVHTRRAYSAALDRLEAWANKEKVNPLELSTGQADAFIRELKANDRSAASVRRDISSVSAFYSWLERYHSGIKNPVRGTRIRPPQLNKKEIVIPSVSEYKSIIAALPPLEKAIIITLAVRGLRAGALPTLELKSGKYRGKSKGKVLKENNASGITLPKEALSRIKAAGLDIKKPFAGYSASAIERRINRKVKELFKAGKIHAPYSCHDFRHYFAVQEYKKRKDIYRLSMLLNHANIAITQTYLKSLDVKV